MNEEQLEELEEIVEYGYTNLETAAISIGIMSNEVDDEEDEIALDEAGCLLDKANQLIKQVLKRHGR